MTSVAVHGDGKLFGVDPAIRQAIAAIPDPMMKAAAIARYEKATSYHHGDPLVEQLRAAIKLPEKDLIGVMASGEPSLLELAGHFSKDCLSWRSTPWARLRSRLSGRTTRLSAPMQDADDTHAAEERHERHRPR